MGDSLSYLDNLLSLLSGLISPLPFHFKILLRGVFSGAPAARRAAKRSPILIWERRGNP